MTPKERPLVQVEWIDACEHVSMETVRDNPLMTLRSRGDAYRKGDAIVLVHHSSVSGPEKPDSSCICIPTAWVKSIRVLRPGKRLALKDIPIEEE